MTPGLPSAEPGRPVVHGDFEPFPGQLALPGMPSAPEPAGVQAVLPGLELTADDADLAAVAAELRAVDRRRRPDGRRDPGRAPGMLARIPG